MKNSVPLVSIVMAVHNEELYLGKCLDSILTQTYTNWELIAVNDHSTDRTPDILKEYAEKDSRIRVFHSERDKLIPTLKEGYKHCRGILINRMDADDYMPDYKLQVLADEWSKYGKGTIIAGGTSHFVDEGEVGEGFQRYDRWLNDVARRNAHYEEIYQECVIPSHCWIIHKDDFDAVGAFDPEVYPEDYDLCFRFYRKGLKVVGIDKILHFWRDHSTRISRTWDCYQDNRYFDLKLRYFYEIDRDRNRPLVLWGAGRNGKDLARLILGNLPFSERSEESPSNQEILHPRVPDSKKRKSEDSSVTTYPSENGSPPIPEQSEGSPSKKQILRQITTDLEKRDTFRWVCDNKKKIGKEIYGIQMERFSVLPEIASPQILIVVNSPEERIQIRKQLKLWNKKSASDYWFFT